MDRFSLSRPSPCQYTSSTALPSDTPASLPSYATCTGVGCSPGTASSPLLTAGWRGCISSPASRSGRRGIPWGRSVCSCDFSGHSSADESTDYRSLNRRQRTLHYGLRSNPTTPHRPPGSRQQSPRSAMRRNVPGQSMPHPCSNRPTRNARHVYWSGYVQSCSEPLLKSPTPHRQR